MAESKMYLLRHGQTVFNVEDRLGGDSSLTAEGIRSAENAALLMKSYNFEAIYCSPLKRSLRTGEILRKHHDNAPIVVVPELTEISAGDFDSMTYAEFENRYPLDYRMRREDKYHWVFPNGESYETASLRVRLFLDSLASFKGNFAVVGHQGINRIILGLLEHIEICDIPYISVPHDVVFEIGLSSRKIYGIMDGTRERGFHIIRP